MNQKTILIILSLCVLGAIVDARTADGSYVCDGGVWTGQKCQTCHTGCTTCDPSFFDSRCYTNKSFGISGCEQGCLSSGTKTPVCQKCKEWYYFKNTGICMDCPTDCESCSGKSNCNECMDNFYLYNGQCVQVPNTNSPAKCAKWSSQTDCKKCMPKYFLKSSTSCVACGTNCDACTDQNTCTKCSLNYILSGGKCTIQCSVLYCVECTLNGTIATCTKCLSTHYLDKDSQCQPKPANCETQDSTDPNKCQVCKDGFSLNATSKSCEACNAPGVIRCSDDKKLHLQCDDNYALISGTSGATCTSLSGNKIDNVYCQTHKSGSICEKCYNDADIVLSAGKCLNCKYGSNSDGCLECSPGTDTVSHTCTKCRDGYYLPSGATTQCNLCSGNTSSGQLACKCDSSGKCIECFPGYYNQTPTSTMTCEPCSDPGCSKCDSDNPNICQTCMAGYYLQYSSGQTNTQNSCAFCSSNCAECDDYGSCRKCYNKARLDNDTQTCITTGVRLSDGINALECDQYYQLEKGICKACYIDGVSSCPSACTDQPSTGGSGEADGGNSSLMHFLAYFAVIVLMML